jgi:hypothetical protein
VPTINVIEKLRTEGFEPYEVRQNRVRDQNRREHTKHMVRLRHQSHISADREEVPELILLNSHDGTSSYQILSGFFRFVCSNGLIAGDVCSDTRVRHSGNVLDDVIEGSFKVLENVTEISKRIGEYKTTALKSAEQSAFASAAMQLRWEPDKAPIVPDQLLETSRWSDCKPDLWSTYNRVQEKLLKGGLSGRTSNGRRTRTRAVGSISEDVRLNKALWTLTEELAKLKAA